MNIELTNEAAEKIGSYVKSGKSGMLDTLLKRGGIVRKEIEPNSGRKQGFERILYYYLDGGYACYDPARARAAERHRNKQDSLFQ